MSWFGVTMGWRRVMVMGLVLVLLGVWLVLQKEEVANHCELVTCRKGEVLAEIAEKNDTNTDSISDNDGYFADGLRYAGDSGVLDLELVDRWIYGGGVLDEGVAGADSLHGAKRSEQFGLESDRGWTDEEELNVAIEDMLEAFNRADGGLLYSVLDEDLKGVVSGRRVDEAMGMTEGLAYQREGEAEVFDGWARQLIVVSDEAGEVERYEAVFIWQEGRWGLYGTTRR